MDERPLRKRIILNSRAANALPVEKDPDAYTKNRASENAKIAIEVSEHIDVKIYFDKHYEQRVQHGEDDGQQRNGIDKDIVKLLVMKCISHMIFYASNIKSFHFLNKIAEGSLDRATRVLCQQYIGNELLNVVIEAHFNSITEYEITVVTALCVDKFRMSEGQYAIEIFEDGSSTLKNYYRRNLSVVCSI